MQANIAPHSAAVSRAKAGVKSVRTDEVATACSVRSTKRAAGRDVVADGVEDARQLGPALRVAGQESRRLGQRPHEDAGDADRHQAAEPEERAPAEHRHQVAADERRERAAERYADDGQGDGERAVAARHVLGRERRGVRHRAAEAEAGEKSQRRQRPGSVDEGDGGGEHAEDEDAADERDAAPEAVADDAGDGAADHHADHAAGDHRRERAARERPVAHHRRHGDAEQLVVDAIEDDGQRGQEDEQLLRDAQWPSSSRRPTSMASLECGTACGPADC